MEKSKVVLEAECNFKDTELREEFERLIVKIETLNDRTKRQTIQIRELEKRTMIMEVKNGRKM